MSLYFEDFVVGSRHKTYARTITESDIVTFCCFAGYHTPLFIDEAYARTTVFGGRIAPSSLTMSISTAMTEALFRDTIVAIKGVTDGRFLAPVRPGDTIRTEVEVVSKRDTSKPDRGLIVFRDHVVNQHGELVFRIDKHVLLARRSEGAAA